MKDKNYLPRLYSLSWNTEEFTLTLKIERHIVPKIQELLRQPEERSSLVIKHIRSLMKESNFELFGEIGQSFGFENVFKWIGENEYELLYSWTLQPLQKFGNEKCARCKGTGRAHFNNEVKCSACLGSGKKLIDTQNNFVAGMFTLHAMTKIFYYLFLDEDLTCDRKQEVHIEFSETNGIHNCYVSGWVSNDVIDWVYHMTAHEKLLVSIAMCRPNEILLLKDPDPDSFKMIFSDKRFWLQAPGSACTLGTEGGMNLFNAGEILSPHNIDSRLQQIAFITGIAKIQDLFSKRILMTQEIATEILDKANPVIQRTVRPEPKDGTCLIKACPEVAVGYGVYTWEGRCGATLFKACQKHLDEYAGKELEKNPFEMKAADELIPPAWFNK